MPDILRNLNNLKRYYNTDMIEPIRVKSKNDYSVYHPKNISKKLKIAEPYTPKNIKKTLNFSQNYKPVNIKKENLNLPFQLKVKEQTFQNPERYQYNLVNKKPEDYIIDKLKEQEGNPSDFNRRLRNANGEGELQDLQQFDTQLSKEYENAEDKFLKEFNDKIATSNKNINQYKKNIETGKKNIKDNVVLEKAIEHQNKKMDEEKTKQADLKEELNDTFKKSKKAFKEIKKVSINPVIDKNIKEKMFNREITPKQAVKLQQERNEINKKIKDVKDKDIYASKIQTGLRNAIAKRRIEDDDENIPDDTPAPSGVIDLTNDEENYFNNTDKPDGNRLLTKLREINNKDVNIKNHYPKLFQSIKAFVKKYPNVKVSFKNTQRQKPLFDKVETMVNTIERYNTSSSSSSSSLK